MATDAQVNNVAHGNLFYLINSQIIKYNKDMEQSNKAGMVLSGYDKQIVTVSDQISVLTRIDQITNFMTYIKFFFFISTNIYDMHSNYM